MQRILYQIKDKEGTKKKSKENLNKYKIGVKIFFKKLTFCSSKKVEYDMQARHMCWNIVFTLSMEPPANKVAMASSMFPAGILE